MVLKLEEGFYMAIHEVEIIRHAPFNIKTEKPKNQISFNVSETTDQSPIKTSWRTFIVGKQAGDLLESNLLANLNEPCKIDDTSWIKPGKSMWDWRIWGYTTT